MTPARVTICVTPGFSQWSVKEQGYEKPIAYFMLKEEAMKYAIAFARAQEAALLQVLDERGRVVSEQHFEMQPEEQPQLPADRQPDDHQPRRG
jgi:hypothetical protein